MYEQVVKPMTLEFQPHLIMFSAGFDAGTNDPLGQLHVDNAFAYILHSLLNIQSKAVLFLEGGYNLNTLQHQTKQIIDVLS